MATQTNCKLSYDTLVAMIPFVMDFLDINSEQVMASGMLDDHRLDDAVIALILSHEKARNRSVGLVVDSSLNSKPFHDCQETKDVQSMDNHCQSSFDELVSTSQNDTKMNSLHEPMCVDVPPSSSSMIAAETSDSFRTQYRMDRATFNILMLDLEQFTSFTESPEMCFESLSPSDKVLLTLHFLGCRQDLSELAAAANVSETTYSSIVHEAVEALYQLLPHYIQWPDESQVIQISDQFRQKCGLQGVVGTIDVLHVPVKAPAEHTDYYTNCLDETTVLLQSVCDDKMRFIHCSTGWPGSMKEETVLKDSDLHNDVCDEVNSYFPFDSYLVGDEAYSTTSWLLTPIADNGNLSTLQQKFNASCCHVLQNNTKAYSHLMKRFPRLECVEMKDMQSIVEMILVCCTLHNLCLDNGDSEMCEDEQVTVRNISTPNSSDSTTCEEGESKRQCVLQLLQES